MNFNTVCLCTGNVSDDIYIRSSCCFKISLLRHRLRPYHLRPFPKPILHNNGIYLPTVLAQESPIFIILKTYKLHSILLFPVFLIQPFLRILNSFFPRLIRPQKLRSNRFGGPRLFGHRPDVVLLRSRRNATFHIPPGDAKRCRVDIICRPGGRSSGTRCLAREQS